MAHHHRSLPLKNGYHRFFLTGLFSITVTAPTLSSNRSAYITILALVVFNFLLHLLADSNSFYHGDELLHIEAGNHPAFGYMDFSPVIAWLAWIQNLFQSQNLTINHLFVHLGSAGTLTITGLLVIQLGGRWQALLLALSCIIFAPGLAASHQLFLPVLFEQLTWVACLYLYTRYELNPTTNRFALLCIAAAIGMLTKYSIAFLLAGIGVIFLLFHWRQLSKKSTWLAIGLFLLVISPNVYWQWSHGLPVFQHVGKLYETQLDHNSRWFELKNLVLYLNPLTLLVWVPGLFYVPLFSKNTLARRVSAAVALSVILLLAANGKTYYFFPAMLGAIAIGSVQIEQWWLEKRKWLLHSYTGLTILFGCLILPMALPVIPLSSYLKIYSPATNEDGHYQVPFENYYSKPVWNKALQTIDQVYQNLPLSEQQNCLVWGRHYGQAGGVNLFRKQHHLPMAFSFHSSCYNWVPYFPQNTTVIVLADPAWDKGHWLRYFTDVQEKAVIHNPYTIDKKWYFQRVFLCRGLKYNSDQLKALFKNEIY